MQEIQLKGKYIYLPTLIRTVFQMNGRNAKTDSVQPMPIPLILRKQTTLKISIPAWTIPTMGTG